jgi:hypothetical protein
MKKLIYLVALLTSLSAAATPPGISEKVLKAFNETFSEAKDVTWKEFANSCEANFKMSEVVVRVTYDNEGDLLQTVRYYREKTLPPNILAKLKKRYEGKEITGVTETTSETEVTYDIVLRDETNWYMVKSDPYANLQQTNKFQRAKEE